ncbi:acyltransferase family protein [Myxococcota bacterium]|nr:acyltransferase family protein [Myxococcota bacterium]
MTDESTPPVSAEPSRGWLDFLLGEREENLQKAFESLVDAGTRYDRYGFSPTVAKQSFPFFRTLYDYYFRVSSEGHEHLPVDGSAVLCANHGGLLPFDAAMGIVDVALHMDPPRVVRTIVDRWVGTLPWVNIFYARVGQVIGTRKNFTDLLRDDQLVLVFPEGMDGIRKTIRQRYQLQEFRVGFVEQALRNRAPIIPVAFVGNDDQMPILYDIKPLARRLGIPVAPITPTFPLLGPLGLLPYPVSYKIVYGEPLRFEEQFEPDAADDPKLVATLAGQVRETVQKLLDRSRK